MEPGFEQKLMPKLKVNYYAILPSFPGAMALLGLCTAFIQHPNPKTGRDWERGHRYFSGSLSLKNCVFCPISREGRKWLEKEDSMNINNNIFALWIPHLISRLGSPGYYSGKSKEDYVKNFGLSPGSSIWLYEHG